MPFPAFRCLAALVRFGGNFLWNRRKVACRRGDCMRRYRNGSTASSIVTRYTSKVAQTVPCGRMIMPTARTKTWIFFERMVLMTVKISLFVNFIVIIVILTIPTIRLLANQCGSRRRCRMVHHHNLELLFHTIDVTVMILRWNVTVVMIVFIDSFVIHEKERRGLLSQEHSTNGIFKASNRWTLDRRLRGNTEKVWWCQGALRSTTTAAAAQTTAAGKQGSP